MPLAVDHVHPVDEVLAPQRLVLLGLRHVLVMAASPITAVFLVGKALNLSSDLTINLISATFLMCGVGTLLQSFGPFKFGARLPFVMVPAGAPRVRIPMARIIRSRRCACQAKVTSPSQSAKMLGRRVAEPVQGFLAVGMPIGPMQTAKARTAARKIRRARALSRALDLAPMMAELQSNGATTLRAVAAVLNERGIPTLRRRTWHAEQVRQLLVRLR